MFEMIAFDFVKFFNLYKPTIQLLLQTSVLGQKKVKIKVVSEEKKYIRNGQLENQVSNFESLHEILHDSLKENIKKIMF